METKTKTVGQSLSPMLCEIEDTLWEWEVNGGEKPDYPIEGFKATIKIFISVLMDKIWELQTNERMPIEERMKMAQKCGEDVRALVKTYTDIDTLSLYQTNEC